MGVLIKRPGDKLKINPIKLWGGVAIIGLVLTGASYFSRYLVGRVNAAKITSTLLATSQAAPSTPRFTTSQPLPEPEDPNCPRVEKDQEGLIVVCGSVVTAQVSKINNQYLQTRTPIPGATVAVYESSPSRPTGKALNGELTNLFSSTETNAQGRYQLTMRGLGPKSSNVYIVALCGDTVGGIKRISSLTEISHLDFAVNCQGDFAYKTPPQTVSYVDRQGFLECVTNIASEVASAATAVLPVGFEQTPQVTTGGHMTEENYDFRYVSKELAQESLNTTGVGTLVGPLFDDNVQEKRGISGALWAPDCVIANPGKEYLCSSMGITLGRNFYEGLSQHFRETYLIYNALNFIPEAERLPGWRRIDNRATFKQYNQSPYSAGQFLQGYFGDPTGQYTGVIKQPNDQADVTRINELDKLASCEDIERGLQAVSSGKNSIVFNPDIVDIANSRLTTSIGIGLASPRTWDKLYNAAEVDLNYPYCVSEETGITYTAKEVYESPELKRRFFHPAMLLAKGAGSLAWNFELRDDSARQEDAARDNPFKDFDSETDKFPRDQAKAVTPELKNRNNSLASAERVAGGLTDDGGFLTGLNSPKTAADKLKEERARQDEASGNQETPPLQASLSQTKVKKPVPVWDVGSYNVGLCSISNVLGSLDANPITRGTILSDLAGVLHNTFSGNADHKTSPVASSGAFITPDSRIRDQFLKGDFKRDVFDSLLEYAASVDRIDLSTLNFGDFIFAATRALTQGIGSSDQKSFGDRGNFDQISEALWVDYPLSADNFEQVFPAYDGPGWVPGSSPDYYPWNDVEDGKFCNVWPGPDEKYGPIEGNLRTCKVESCQVLTEKWIRKPNGELDLEPRSETCANFPDAIRTCLVRQLDTGDLDYGDIQDPPKIEGRSTKDPIPNGLKCSLRVAGPYTYIAPVERDIDGQMEQKDLNQNAVETPVDALSNSAYNINASFASPGGSNLKEMKLANNDWEYSKNDYTKPTNLGYDVPGIGIATEGLNSISASPTTSSIKLNFKDLYYHCNLSFEGTPASGVNIVDATWNCDVKPFVPGVCDPTLFNNIPGGIPSPVSQAQDYFDNFEIDRLTPEVVDAYGFGSANSGVPCEILAGIHYQEAHNNPSSSILAGDVSINPADLPINALAAAEALKGAHPYEDISRWTFEDYADALSNYNGGGNDNCIDPKTIWGQQHCPGGRPDEPFWGWGDIYPMSWMDGAHVGMYIKYCGNHVLCDVPLERNGPGVLPVAKMFNDLLNNLGGF